MTNNQAGEMQTDCFAAVSKASPHEPGRQPDMSIRKHTQSPQTVNLCRQFLYAQLAPALLACGSEDVTCVTGLASGDACEQATLTDAFDSSLPREERLEALDYDLGVGSRGGEVLAIHEYLTTYGYFPNEELGQTYAEWRPVVAEPPGSPEIYDEQTQAAVRAFQGFFGLTATGIVDAPTRALMSQPRCGVPEGFVARDPSEKYDIDQNNRWDPSTGLGGEPRNIRWKVMSVAGLNLTLAQVEAAVSRAESKWDTQIKELNLSKANAGATVDMEIRSSGLGGNTLGTGSYPDWNGGNDNGGDITIDNSNRTWTETQLEFMLTHEVGHAIGLRHSGFTSAVMFEGGSGSLALRDDDNMAATVLYDKQNCNGLGKGTDVAVGDDGSDDTDSQPELWKVSNTATAGGYKVYHWETFPPGWEEAPGRGAVAIAVDSDGLPWIVDDDGRIFNYPRSEPETANLWNEIVDENLCAIDIGVGGNDTDIAWVVGCDHKVWKFDSTPSMPGAEWTLEMLDQNSSFAVRRIAVSGSAEVWVLGNDQTIWSRQFCSPGSTNRCWKQTADGFANDIGVGDSSAFTWVVGAGSGSSFPIWAYIFNVDPPGTPAGGFPAVARDTWLEVEAAGKAIAVTPRGRPVWVGSNDEICFWGDANLELGIPVL